MKVTITDVAARAGVSIATVSRYINDSAKIKPTTAKAIKEAISELNYPVPYEKNASSDIILVNIPSPSNPFSNEIIKGMQNTAAKNGYKVLCNYQYINNNTEANFFDLVKELNPAGVIMGNALSKSFCEKLSSMVPLVQSCEFTDNSEFTSSSVCINNAEAMYKITNYLISIGHKKIALLSGPIQYRYSQERVRGFKRALKDSGITVPESWLVYVPNVDFDAAYATTINLIKNSTPFTALVCASDIMAGGAIRALNDSGLKVPDDVSVTGFDNVVYSKMLTPSLTTINQPQYNIGESCINLILECINNPKIKPTRLSMPSDLIIRESTRALGPNE